MNIKDILLSNYFTLLLILGMILLTATNKIFSKRNNNYFIALIIIVFLLDVTDMIDYHLSSYTHLNNIRYIISSLGYILRPASLATIINIVNRRKRFNKSLWIPIGILSIIALSSRYTHVMYWFTSDNAFMRGPLSYLSHFISAAYMLILIISMFRVNKYLDIGEIITIIFIAISCTFATILESIYDYKFLLPGTMMISCTLYYIILYVQSFRKDGLTGAMNRKSLITDCESWNHSTYSVVSVDLNKLKTINDTKGHREGDKALCTLCDKMMSAQKGFRVYRIGGDEFIAIGKDKTEQETINYINKVRELLKDTAYMASLGFAVHHNKDNIKDTFHTADLNMYEDKKTYNINN